MALIEGIGRRTLVPKPVIKKPVITEKPVKENVAPQGSNNSVSTRRSEMSEQAEFRRFNLQRELYRAQYGVSQEVQPEPTIEERARAAAQEVQDAYNEHPNFVISTPGNGRDPNEPWAQEAAAQRLREVTENEPPEVVALIIEYSKPTLDQIGYELGRTAERYDGGYGDSRPDFDDVIDDLAVVANRAAQAPNGSEAVSIIAESVVSRISPNDIGRFDEALGRAVENGNPELTAEIIKQLQAAGRTGQADDILQNVEDAINNIRGELSDAVEDAGKYNEELGWLIAQWQPMMTEEQLTGAIEAYKAENPEYVEALNRIDEASVEALRALTAFQNAETNFDGLGHSDDVQGALEHLFGDEKVQFGIAQSQAATEELARLLDRSEYNPDANNVLDGIIGIAGTVDDGDFLTQEIFNKIFDITIDRSLNAATATQVDPVTGQVRVDDFGRVENVTEQLDRLQRYADRLGYSSEELTDVINQLDRVARSETEGQARARLRTLNNRLDDLASSNPDLFGENSRFYSKFENFGLFLGVVGAASSINGAISEPEALNIINAVVDTSDVAVSALQTRIATNLLQRQPWFSRLPLGAASKALGGIGLVLDTYNIADNIAKGNYVEAGFSTAGAAGGALLVFGTTAAATGVGLILVGGAVIGSFIYGNIKEANKHETDGARAFLEGAGINPDLANELINNDDGGRSPAPVFVELANRLDIEPQEMFDYLATLSSDEAKRLVETAHGVDPNDEGVFPDSVENRRGRYYNPRPNDVNDLIEWMRENGYENAPGL